MGLPKMLYSKKRTEDLESLYYILEKIKKSLKIYSFYSLALLNDFPSMTNYMTINKHIKKFLLDLIK